MTIDELHTKSLHTISFDKQISLEFQTGQTGHLAL